MTDKFPHWNLSRYTNSPNIGVLKNSVHSSAYGAGGCSPPCRKKNSIIRAKLMYRSGKDTVKNILLFNILIYLFSSHFRITVYYTCGWLTKSSVNFNQGLRATTRRFCAHWAKSYSAVLQASTTSKLYEISMAWIVKCYQVRSQSLKTTTAGTHAREKTQPWW